MSWRVGDAVAEAWRMVHGCFVRDEAHLSLVSGRKIELLENM